MKKIILVGLSLLMVWLTATAKIDLGIYPGYYGSDQDKTFIPIDRVDGLLGHHFGYRSIYYNLTAADLDPALPKWQLFWRQVDTIIAIGATPIVMAQLDKATDLAAFMKDVDDVKLKLFLKELAKRQCKILLSWCHEMNGTWNSWGQQADLYKKSFVRIHDLAAVESANIKLCWVPNLGDGFPFIPNNALHKDSCYSYYYPGRQYVDYVGLNIYFRDWGETNQLPAGWFRASLEYRNFYNTYASVDCPMLILETSSFDANWDSTTVGVRLPLTTAQQEAQKVSFLQQVLDPATLALFPNLKIICFFHVLKVEPINTKTHTDQYTFFDIETDWRLPFTLAQVKAWLDNPFFDTTPVEETADNPMPAYPNPTAGSVTIANPWNRPYAWELSCVADGSKVADGYCDQAILRLDLAYLPAGSYLFRQQCAREVKLVKIVHFK